MLRLIGALCALALAIPAIAGAQTVDNPSFTVDSWPTAGWTASTGSSIGRLLPEFDTAPASGLWDGQPTLGTGVTLTGALSGTFRRGYTYRLEYRVRAPGSGYALSASLGAAWDRSTRTPAPVGGVFTSFEITWSPTADATGVRFILTSNSVVGFLPPYYMIDSLVLTSQSRTCRIECPSAY